jgi:hypothetical protein
MSRNDDQLKSFLKTYAPEGPPAPENELNEILEKIDRSPAPNRSRARKGFSMTRVGLLAASLALAWTMGSKMQTLPNRTGKFASSHSDEWAAELIASELSNDDDLPASQIGEDYLGLMADNAIKSK